MTSDHTESVAADELSTPRSSATLAPGTLIDDRYELGDVFGRGGYAVVYRAYDRRLREEVALKVLRPERLGPTPRARLRREAAVAREADSPRLLRIFDVVLGESLCYLAMEVVHGGSLASRLDGGPLAIAEAVQVVAQVLEGLAALHALGIVHRDVKPANILLTAAGDVKLADFGLALRFASDETRATIGDAVVGTIDYLAPEQVLGRDADERSDLYSVGVVLFEMLTGEMPHRTGSALGALVGHVRGTPRELRALRPDVPPYLAALVVGLLEREPRRRYATAAAALADLRAGSRWRSRRVRARAGRLATAAVALAGLALGAARYAAQREPRFSHLARTGDGGTQAVTTDGSILWSAPLIDAEAGSVVARLHEDEPPRVVMAERPGGTYEGRFTRRLSILDADTGRVLRHVELESGASHFPGFADQYAPVLRAVDLDGDGLDEIVASYFHNPYWPSYTVLYEPRIERSRLVFLASGHHRFAGAEDLDGDGQPELLFYGINNRMGWYTAVAAVKLSPPTNEVSRELDRPSVDESTPNTPDASVAPPNLHGLYFYALGPRRPLSGWKSLHVDREARIIELRYADDSVARFDWRGFLLGDSSSLAPQARAAERAAAYLHLGECTRLTLARDFPQQALAECRAATAGATAAGDRFLAEWSTRALGKAQAAQGLSDQAAATFTRVLEQAPGQSDAAYDAATAFHLRGQLERAVAWYRRGYGPGAVDGAGRGKYEFLEGLVLALGELGRWEEADAEIERFVRLYPMNLPLSAPYRQYVRWREGLPIDVAALGDTHAAPDLQRYWALELRRRAGEEGPALLGDVEAELARASETVGLVRALRAELLVAEGRSPDAAAEARDALQWVRAALPSNLAAAAHYALVAARCASVLRAAGAGSEARSVERELAGWQADRRRAYGT